MSNYYDDLASQRTKKPRKRLPLHVIKLLNLAKDGEPGAQCSKCKEIYQQGFIKRYRDPNDWFHGEKFICRLCLKELNIAPVD